MTLSFSFIFFKTHLSTTTGQNVDMRHGGSVSNCNIIGSWSNGWNVYTGGQKNGGRLFIPANGGHGYVEGVVFNVGLEVLNWRAVTYRVYYGGGNIALHENYVIHLTANPGTFTFALRAVHD